MEPNPYKSPEADLDDASPIRAWLDWADRAFSLAAQRSGLDVNGLRFVSEALSHAPRLIAGAAPGQHLRGWQLCEAVAKYAQEQFGSDAADTLSKWGLVTGEDIGRAVDAQLKEGLLRASAEDSKADFAGLGSLAAMIGGGSLSRRDATKQNPYQSPIAAPNRQWRPCDFKWPAAAARLDLSELRGPDVLPRPAA